MKNLLFVIALLSFALFLAAPAFAQNALNGEAQTVSELNRIKPLQNPQYQKAEDTLSRRILDRKNKVIGNLKDIIVGGNGGVNALNVEFDRLRLTTPVTVNYNNLKMKSSSNGYAVGFTDEEVAGFYPNLLAQVETAAGADANDNLSIRKIIGAEIYALDGRRIGAVENVLFDVRGERAQLLYVKLSANQLSSDGVAIPFDDASYGSDAVGRTKLTIGDSLANAMIDYAK